MSQARLPLVDGGQPVAEERVKQKRTSLLDIRLNKRTFSRTFKY